MEKCAHCHKVGNDKKNWKSFIARYHEVEIRHFVCPQCHASSFPRFYRLYENSSQPCIPAASGSLMNKDLIQGKKIRPLWKIALCRLPLKKTH